MFQHRMFQADPHAANLILMDDGYLGYIDFGMIGWLDERVWKQQFRLRQHVANEKIHAAYLTILDMLDYVPQRKAALFEMQVKGAIRDWISAASSPNASIAQKSSGVFFLNLFNTIRKANIKAPLGVSRLFRTMLIADILMLRVDPSYDWMPTLQSFVNDQIQHEFVQSIRSGANLANIMTSFLQAGEATNQGLDFLSNLSELPHASRQQQPTLNLVILAILQSLQRLLFIFVGFTILVPFIFQPNHPVMRFVDQLAPQRILLVVLVLVIVLVNHLIRVVE
jgi:predicted unusual protein kinase regulating ubiquinone biosynthesis (AarF/ABC1/UbiB family)